MRYSLLCFAFIFLCISATAQVTSIDAVILSTNVNYPDSFISAAAAEKIGVPVLLTNKDSIPNETMNEIEILNAKTIYIIGGPAVVGVEVEDELKNKGYDVIRIWGMTRYGTSSEVAKYFWSEGSDEAVIVADNTETPERGNSDFVITARDLAKSINRPLLITSNDTLSSSVYDTLKSLGVKRVKLVGNFDNSIINELNDMGIEISEKFSGNASEVARRIREKIKSRTRAEGNKTRLVVVAVANWKDKISAPYHPGNSVTRLISNESQIPRLIEDIKSSDYEDIKVVGIPWLADDICDALVAQGIDVECITGNVTRVAARMVEKEIFRIQKIREKFKNGISKIADKLKERVEEINQTCIEFFELANSTIDALEENITDIQEYRNIIRELNYKRTECLDSISRGNYTRARDMAQRIKSNVEMMRWRLRNLTRPEFQRRIEWEIRSIAVAGREIERVRSLTEDLKNRTRGVREEVISAKKHEIKKEMETTTTIRGRHGISINVTTPTSIEIHVPRR